MKYCKDCKNRTYIDCKTYNNWIARGFCVKKVIYTKRLATCENFERADHSDRTCRDCEMFSELPPDRAHYANVVICNCPVPPQFESGFIVNTMFAEVCELYTPKE